MDDVPPEMCICNPTEEQKGQMDDNVKKLQGLSGMYTCTRSDTSIGSGEIQGETQVVDANDCPWKCVGCATGDNKCLQKKLARENARTIVSSYVCHTNPTHSPGTSTPTSPNSNEKLSGGAVAGIVVGVVFFLLLIVGGLLFSMHTVRTLPRGADEAVATNEG